MTEQFKDYLKAIVQPLVKHPEEVQVTESMDERGILLSLKVNPEDMGRVIGKEGETARSVRRLLRQLGMDNKASVAMKIEEPTQRA